MPSSQLALLCEHIEKQDTDDFGKFYMYVSLLNTVTVRDKTFKESLPKYSGGIAFWRDNQLKTGEISIEFTQQLNSYSREFINTQPHWSTALYNIAMTYVRKGKISDLIHIIDQMLNHLAAINDTQSHNQEIASHIDFNNKKIELIKFIIEISTFNKQLLTVVDSGCNTALSVLTMTTGLVLALASVFYLIPTAIGLGLIIGGAYGIYHFVSQLKATWTMLEAQLTQISQKMDDLPKDESLLGDINHNKFYLAALKPLPYAAITGAEQIIIDASHKDYFAKKRVHLDVISAIMSV